MDEDMNGIGAENDADNADIRLVKHNEKSKKTKRRLPGVPIILLLIIVVIAIISVIFINRGRDVDMTESNVLVSRDYELSSKADFYTCGSNIFYATKDSLRLMDQKGKEAWVDSFTMISPVMLGDKNTVAIAEKNGNNIRVYNESGFIYNVTFNEPVARDGIPTAMDISDDGRMFAVSFMNINNIKLQSNILFYYIDNAEANGVESSNGMYTSVVCEDCMPFMLKFTPDNKCVALMDDRAVFIDPAESGETQKLEVSLGNSIGYACVNGDGTVAIALGEPLLNAAEQLEKNTVLWYNSNGDKVNEYKAERDITGLFYGDDITVIAMDRYFEAYKTKGGSVWQYTALQDTTKVLAYNGNDKMLAVTPVRAVLAKVGKGNNLIETATNAQGNTQETTEAVSSENTEESTADTSDEETTVQESTASEQSETQTEPVSENTAA